MGCVPILDLVLANSDVEVNKKLIAWYFPDFIVFQFTVAAVISSTNEKQISNYWKGDYLGTL